MNLKLNSEEWKKVITGGFVAIAGAGLTYLYQYFYTEIPTESLPLYVSAFSVLANYVRKAWGVTVNVPLETK